MIGAPNPIHVVVDTSALVPAIVHRLASDPVDRSYAREGGITRRFAPRPLGPPFGRSAPLLRIGL